MSDDYGVVRSYRFKRGWRTDLRNAVIRRDQCCRQCGSVENLQLHHIVPAGVGEDHIDNLMLLCRRCHGQISAQDKHRKRNDRGISKDVLGLDTPTAQHKRARARNPRKSATTPGFLQSKKTRFARFPDEVPMKGA